MAMPLSIIRRHHIAVTVRDSTTRPDTGTPICFPRASGFGIGFSMAWVSEALASSPQASTITNFLKSRLIWGPKSQGSSWQSNQEDRQKSLHQNGITSTDGKTATGHHGNAESMVFSRNAEVCTTDSELIESDPLPTAA